MGDINEPYSFIKDKDSQLYNILLDEVSREEETLELIASENFVSYPVLEMAGSAMTNKYAEGYPGARYYGGCEFVDKAENLARERAKHCLSVITLMFSLIQVLKQIWQY